MSFVYNLHVTLFVLLLLLRPPIFRLNEDAILHIFLYLSAKDRVRIERGKYMKCTMERHHVVFCV